MKKETNLLIDKVSDFENLYFAFRECSRGKKSKNGYQNFLFSYGEKLSGIEQEIKLTSDFKWSGYREFYVHDPKKRLVMAAPFRDRIVHTALHRIMFPIVDPTLGARTYACRIGKGNKYAAIRLLEQLKAMGKNRYCVKLDVQKYFESISHERLFNDLRKQLPDESLNKLLWSLILSHPRYRELGKGIPIGNLTSQLFANFYLTKLDYLATNELEINFHQDLKEDHAFYIRYMDDIVIIARDKTKAIQTAKCLVDFAKSELSLNIPDYKFMVIGNDPIPFLGYVLDESGYRVLRRNEQKFNKKIKRMNKKEYSLSAIEQVLQSYRSWEKLI